MKNWKKNSLKEVPEKVSKGVKGKKNENAAETTPRSKREGGQITKKKVSKSTPVKSKIASKREFFMKNFEVSKLGQHCGHSGSINPNNFCNIFTNPLLVEVPRRLAASQWDELKDHPQDTTQTSVSSSNLS